MNGAAPLAAPMNGAHNGAHSGAPNGAANAPSDNRQRINDAPAAPPISMPAPFPQAAQAKQQPPSQSRPLAAKGADAPHLAPPPPAGLQPNPLQNGSPLPSIMQPPKDRAPERAPPNIVSPLANALARASAAPPPAPAATTPALPTSPLAAPSIVPASLRSDTPTIVPPPSAPPPLPSNGAGFPSQPSTQPDFSTLPPSIAASLARLAGTPLPTGRTSGGPASPDATTSEQKAAPKVSSGA